MIKRLDAIPSILKTPYPYKDRPRTHGVYGVTEIIYCLRKSMLSRVVPAPTALTFETRRAFSRGHACESVFFGDIQNPVHFKGGMVEGRDFTKIEGHTDHSTVDEDGKSTIIEFKTTKKLWLKGPDGRAYFSPKAARASVPKDQWDLIETKYSDAHMDQLMFYMLMTGSSRGYLIYQEMSTDQNYVWSVEYEDISEEFKDAALDRLNLLDYCFVNNEIPKRCPSYDFECKLCNMAKNGLCDLCDQKDFDLGDFIKRFSSMKDPFAFMPMVKEEYDKRGMDSSHLQLSSPDNTGSNGKNGKNT
jgi:hypothetical protein